MKTIIYLLQVSACTGIFYAFYFLLLRRLTFFTLNRWYLLGTLVLSFVIPTISLTIDTARPPAIMQPVMYVNRIQVVDEPLNTVYLPKHQQEGKRALNWVSFIQTAYVAIAAISVIHLLFTLLVFARRMKNKELMQIGNVKVLKASKELGNSSFLNVIFVNDDELEPGEIKQIIAHELLHIKLMHSADRLFARLILIVLWFNPFAYFYTRSIEENHEFEVDRIAAGDADKGIYATLLFKLSVSGQSYLMHSFSKVPLKSRIAMLFNKPTSNMKKIIYALVLPVVAISCLAFANLQPKLSAKHPFYILTKSKTRDGVALETRKVSLPDGKGAMGSIYKAGEKVVFIVDGKVFTETEVNEVEALVRSLKVTSWTSGKVKDYRGKTDKDISRYNSYFEFITRKSAETTLVDTNISINKYRQIDRFKGKHSPYPDFSKSPEYIKSRKMASRIENKLVTYKITGVTTTDVNTGVKLPRGYTMTNEGDEFVLTTSFGPGNVLDYKLNIGDEVQVKGMAISLIKKAMVIVIAENITKGGKLIYKVNPEAIKDTTAFGFEGNRVRYMYGKVTDIQKYANGKWKSAVVVKRTVTGLNLT
jgi:hypothetical protein